jgi:FAD/FMN-containing dehydrogenase
MNDETARGSTEFIFNNWDSTIICFPDNYFQPRTEAEVVEIVKDAYKRGVVVRTFGAGHSWSPLVPTDDTLINLDNLDKAVAIDKGRMRASVQAGIRIKNLIKLLRANGQGMRNLGSIKEQSIAGAVSTATHGTGRNIGNISTQIVGMNLVTGRGDVLTISEERDHELMSAARTSLGALGIITQVTIQCVRDYNLLYKSEPQPFEEVLDHLDDYLSANERVRLYWLTLNRGDIQVMTMNPTTTAAADKKELVDALTGDVIKKGVVQPVSANTYDLHYWQGLGLKVGLDKKGQAEARVTWIEEEKVKPYDEALTVPMPPHHQESEYAIPVGRAAEAVRALRRLIEEKGYIDTILVEVRFVGQDDIMLSPSHDGPVCYVGGYIFGELNASDFFENYESLMKGFGGRPHWGKHLTLSPQEARHMYPGLDRFNEIRKELDPEGIFANDFIRNLFG